MKPGSAIMLTASLTWAALAIFGMPAAHGMRPIEAALLLALWAILFAIWERKP